MFRKFLLALVFLGPFSAFAQQRDVIVITDMEPDDRIALELIAARLSSRVQMIGTTVKNSFRKAALVQNQLSETDLSKTPIVVGSGGEASSYTDIASSRAAREYSQEGEGILSGEMLRHLKSPKYANGSEQLQKSLVKSLTEALEKQLPVEFLLLAPPTDLIVVLGNHPELKAAIKHIHVMGGWVDVMNTTSGAIEKRSTYNVNMDAPSSAELLKLDIPMTLYSSHIIKPYFAGGSVNRTNFPEIIDAIESSRAHGLEVFRNAGKSWDTHLIEKIPALKGVIGENAGRQFTPADPLVVVGMFNPSLITSSIQADISIDLNDLDHSRGYRMDVADNPTSKIRLVTGIDPHVFSSEMMESLKITDMKSKSYRPSNARSCGAASGG